MTREFDVGVELVHRKEYARAARAFEEVLLGDPHHARAWSFLGVALAHLGRAPEAEQALRRALTLAPGNGEAWFHLGVAQSLEADWAAAADTLRHAVGLLPNDLTAWHRLGVALAESGDREGSSAAFERALILSREAGLPAPPVRPARPPADDHLVEPGEREGPKEADSWLSLALSLLTLGEVEEAVAAYERAYDLDPDRSRHSMFRPMLNLLTATAGAPPEEMAGGRMAVDRPVSPLRPPHPPGDDPVDGTPPVTGVG